jgi:7,8-dihydropterin-6-yl-methyl-4-(beta-D-ribofuranosyl)aminobenzene 5'-phosphate synthase
MPAALRDVEAVEIEVVVDGSVDLRMPPTGPVQGSVPVYDWWEGEQIRAEDGLALLVRTHVDGEVHAVVFDTGLARDTFVHNAAVLDLGSSPLEAIVVSHGHQGHVGGLAALIERQAAGVPIVVHPDVRLDRRVVLPSGSVMHMPPLPVAALEHAGARVVEEPGPSLWAADTVLVSGEVARTTRFEPGLPTQQTTFGDAWAPDPWTWDDQSLIVHVRDHGLVVIAGCAHAGPVNTLRNARTLTGIERIHAYVGGMHLASAPLADAIEPTIDGLAEIGFDYVIPAHCTGMAAMTQLVARFGSACIPSGAGLHLLFGEME